MDKLQLSDLPYVLTVPEAAQVLRLSRNGAYAAVQAGDLPAIRVGRRLLVPRALLERMLSVGATDHQVDERGRHEAALAGT